MFTNTLPKVRSLWAEVMSSSLIGLPIEFAMEKMMCWPQQRQALKKWNKTTFGNLKQKIVSAEARVLHCQQVLDSDYPASHQADLSAKAALHEELKAQEVKWRQKSRLQWLNEGDNNTKFFHLSAKARSSFNSIKHTTIDGIKIEDPAIIQAQAVDYFLNLFIPHEGTPDSSLFQTNCPKVSNSQNLSLTSMPSDSEIQVSSFFFERKIAPLGRMVLMEFSLHLMGYNWRYCNSGSATFLPNQEDLQSIKCLFSCPHSKNQYTINIC